MAEVIDNQQAITDQSGVALNQGRFWALAVLLALSIAALLLAWWLMHPSYSVLTYTSQMDKMAAIAKELQNSNIKYQYNSSTGEMSVPTTQIYQARMALANKGLVSVTSNGSNLPGVDPKGFYVSHQPGNLEQELASTIASIEPVQSARVHLALVDESKADSQRQSRASVVVHLYPDRRLSGGQINAISELVASSAQGLSVSRIAIVDQSGRLLKSTGVMDANPLTTSQFDYRQQIERDYVERIEKILTPIVGSKKIRCQVTAVMNFDRAAASEDNATAALPGTLRHLSVTVLVDDKEINSASGSVRRVSRSQQELERITILIKEAIGYQSERGDKVNVINEPFNVAPVTTTSWKNDFFSTWEDVAIKNWYVAGAAVLLLALVGFIVKRLLVQRVTRQIPENDVQHVAPVSTTNRNVSSAQENAVGTDVTTEFQESAPLFEQKIHEVREIVFHDPGKVAQVLKQWVKEG